MSPELIGSNLALFAKVLSRAHTVQSVVELGANIGLNLIALQHLLPTARLTGVEINARAFAELRKNAWLEAHHRDPKFPRTT